MASMQPVMTAAQAAAELAREELREKWADEEYQLSLNRLKDRHQRELKMQQLRVYAQPKVCIDLTDSINDNGDTKSRIKSEPPTEHVNESGHVHQETPAPITVAEALMQSHESSHSMLFQVEEALAPTLTVNELPDSALWPNISLRKFREQFAVFEGPDFVQLPTIVNDPHGVVGSDYVELRCGKCGANSNGQKRLFKGVHGFYGHIRSLHRNDVKEEGEKFPSAAEILEMCKYRKLSREEVDSLLRNESKIEAVRGPGAEPDHPSRRKRRRVEKQGNQSDRDQATTEFPGDLASSRVTGHDKLPEAKIRGRPKKQAVQSVSSKVAEHKKTQPRSLGDRFVFRRSPPPKALADGSEFHQSIQTPCHGSGPNLFRSEKWPFRSDQR